MSTFKLTANNPAPKFAFTVDKPVVALDEKYRPRTVADMLGNGQATFDLECFLETPFSVPLFFAGDSGIGKTTAALALANDLGADEWSIIEIPSGEQTGEAVATALRALRHAAFSGSGWKVVIVNEADHMSPKAEYMWLSALEEIKATYSKSVVIFTTNHPEKFESRFTDRCKLVTFEAVDMQDAQAMIDRVWAGEQTPGNPPAAESLRGIRDKDGKISMRRVVQLLESHILRAKRDAKLADANGPKPELIADPELIAHQAELATAAERRKQAISQAKGFSLRPSQPVRTASLFASRAAI